jgi:hypothetical protein
VCDHPIDERHQGILPSRIWATATPRTSAAARPRRSGTPPAPRPRSDRHRHRLHRLVQATGHRPPAGLRPQLRPEPLRRAGPRPGRLPLGLSRPDLPRGLQGGEEAPERPQRAALVPPAVGRSSSRLGLRIHRSFLEETL